MVLLGKEAEKLPLITQYSYSSTSGDNLTTGSGNVLIGSGIDVTVDNAITKIAGYDGSSTTTDNWW